MSPSAVKTAHDQSTQDAVRAYETLDAEAYVAGAARLVLDEFVRT